MLLFAMNLHMLGFAQEQVEPYRPKGDTDIEDIDVMLMAISILQDDR